MASDRSGPTISIPAALTLALLAGCTSTVDGGTAVTEDAALTAAPDSGGAGGASGDAAPAPCTVLPANAGCPADQTCDYDDAGTPACRAFAAGAQSTVHCFYDRECDAGWTCEHQGGTGARQCKRYCNVDTDCPRDGVCYGSDPLVRMCSDPCAPNDPGSGCPAGSGCVFSTTVAADGTPALVCYSGGTVATGGECQAVEDCQPGNICVAPDEASPGVCRAFCRITAPASGCATGQCYEGYFPPADGVEYGICI